MRATLLAIAIMALLLSASCHALGIAPGHTDLTFEPGVKHKVDLKIINSDHKAFRAILYAEGELADYITFDEMSIDIRQDQDERLTSYTVSLPASFDKQGLHRSSIVVREIALESKGDGVAMSATAAIGSKLNVMVPYSGKYAEITLFSPQFELGKPSNFAIEVRNLGTEGISDGKIVVEIYSPFNATLRTLAGDTFALKSKEKTVSVVNWMPDLEPGQYKAVATLHYDGNSAQDKQDIILGELMLNINDITVKDFKLGGIAKFDIIVENTWNNMVPGAYGDVSVTDGSGKTYATYKTASMDINPHETQLFQAYWDTKNVGPGTYKLNIALNYVGKRTERVFDILVSLDTIRASLAGQVVGVPAAGEAPTLMKTVYLLVILVFGLIAFNIYVYLKKVKGK